MPGAAGREKIFPARLQKKGMIRNNMNKHTLSDLYQMQSLPLSAKIRMTQYRIREWVEYYGTDGVYIAFSGGKDSSLLLHIAREMYPEIGAVYVDTGLEYPEVREFVRRQKMWRLSDRK